jgi:hypothetical protein
MNFASLQVMSAPEGGENGTPTTIVGQPGAVSVNGDGTVTTRGPQQFNTSEFTRGGTGILSTARTKTGSPCMGDVQATDIVEVRGTTCRVDIAEQLGFLKRDASGRYVEAEGGADATQTEKKQDDEAPADSGEALSDTKAETELTTLCSSVFAGTQINALQQIINRGAADAATITHAASEARMEPSQMNAHVQNVMDAFRAQAVTTVQGHGGADAETFFDWARENKPREMKAAMQAHGMERSTKGYEPIFREYVASIADDDPEAVLSAKFGGGIKAQRIGKDVVLTIPGRGQMTYRTALKEGLIKVSGA